MHVQLHNSAGFGGVLCPYLTVGRGVGGPGVGGAAVRDRLRAAGFAVRRGDTFPGLGPDWIRIAVRDRVTNERFARALASAMGYERESLQFWGL